MRTAVVLALFVTGCFADPPQASTEESERPETCREAWARMADECVEEWEAVSTQCADGEESAVCIDRREAYASCVEQAGGDWNCGEGETSTCPSWAVIVCDFSFYADECALAESACTDDVARP